MSELGTVTLAGRRWSAVRHPDGRVEYGTSAHVLPASTEVAASFESGPVGQEPTAIRRPKIGKAHRDSTPPRGTRTWRATACGSGVTHPKIECVPLSSVPPADRCPRCWPAPTTDTKETK